MKYENKNNPLWEADCYLEKAQNTISRSLHELASITGKKNGNRKSKFVVKRQRQSSTDLRSSSIYGKNSFSAASASQHDIVNIQRSFSSSNDDKSADAEYNISSRRKRLTRRRRRNSCSGIFGKRISSSTSALNKKRKSESTTSSSDSENIKEQKKRSFPLTITEKKNQLTTTRGATTTAFHSLRRNYLNSNLITQSTAEIFCKSTLIQALPYNEPVDNFQKFKGPAARKTHRHRTFQNKSNSISTNRLETKIGSQIGLHNYTNVQKPENGRPVQRSISVRELNATMIDFTNQDSVVRWTSQILAELDSLPSSSFNLTGQSILQSSSLNGATATSTISTGASSTIADDDDTGCHNELDCRPLKQNVQLPAENNSNTLFEVNVINSTQLAQSYNDDYWKKRVISKSSSSGFQNFQKTKSFKKDIWRQSTDIPETSCTAEISVKAKRSNNQKQSAHAIVINASKNSEKPEQIHFLSSKWSNKTDDENWQNSKNANSNNELTRLWRLLSQRKFKKYLKDNSTIRITPTAEVSRFNQKNSSLITNGENRSSESNLEFLESKWKSNKVEKSGSLLLPKANLTLALNLRPYQRFKQMQNSAHQQLPDFMTSNDVKWRKIIDDTNAAKNNDARNRTCFSMESIALTKENGNNERLKFLGKTKRIQLYDQMPSPVKVWKRKTECGTQKFETFDNVVVDDTKELNCSNTPNSMLTAVQQSVDNAETLATTLSSDLTENIEKDGKSVHGIVTSLIRTAEETHFQPENKFKSLNLNNKFQQQQPSTEHQETGTQTSPYTLSRSSSFDWFNDSSPEDQYSEELTIISTESAETSEDPDISSINRTAESLSTAEKEIQEMLHKNTEIHDSLSGEKKNGSSGNIDESIAMLLEYAEDLDVVPNRKLNCLISNEKLTKPSNDIRNGNSGLTHEIPSDISKNRISPMNKQNEFWERFTSSTANGNGTIGLALRHTHLGKSSSQGSMNGSIYDNVPCGIKQTAALQASLLANTSTAAVTSATASSRKDSNDFTSASTKLNHVANASQSLKAMDNLSSSSNGSASSQCVSSSMADEKSAMIPSASTSISLHHNIKHEEKQSNFGKNGSQLTQMPIDLSFEMEKNVGQVRSSPTFLSHLDPTNRTSSMVLASDLFVFSTGRIPERAESCEELDGNFIEQASNKLYAQKKQKAEDEAIECVRWLRDAGFPQYARLYEENRFPIDIRSVKRDHEFLDDDSLRALFRRLNALNRCAIMKVENVVLRKHPERFDINQLETDIDDDMIVTNYDDDDDQVAISNKWKYQRNSQTWSRIARDDDSANTFNGDDNVWPPEKEAISGTELDEALQMSFGYGRNSKKQSNSAANFKNDLCNNRNQRDNNANLFMNRNNRKCPDSSSSTVTTVNLQRSQSEKLKERARALMKRMDIRSSSRRRRQRGSSITDSTPSTIADVSHSSPSSAIASSSVSKTISNAGSRDLVIGDPVLVSHFSASPQTMRMFPNGLSNVLSSQTVTPQILNQFRRGTIATTADNHASDGVTFAMLQPTVRQQQQQQQISSDCEIASPQYNSLSSPYSQIRTRFLGASNRRIGMVLDSSGSFAITNHQRHESLSRSKARDLSYDPTMVRRLPRHDEKTRIYDRVAEDLHPDKTEYAYPRHDKSSGIMHNGKSALPSSSQHCYANNANFSSSIRRGLQFSGDILSDNSLNYDELKGLHRQNVEYDRDRGLTSEQTYARSRLVVNPDGYYEHIPSDDIHDISFELATFSPNLDNTATSNVAGVGTSGVTVSIAACDRAVSPESSSSNTSIYNHANRLKTEIDGRGGKRLGYNSGSSSFSAVKGLSVQRSHSSLESSGNDDELTRQPRSVTGERRDSGVGSSLSRSPSGPTTQRQRKSLLFTTFHDQKMKSKLLLPCLLNAFRDDCNETFISDANLAQCMDALTVSEMQQMRKLAFLKLSVMIETYAGTGIRIGVITDNNGTGRVSKSWAVHKFIRRMRNNDSINSNIKPTGTEISTFGLPLTIIQSRSGFALPRFILEMMHFLRIAAPDTVGIFRKSGVRSRITELRMLCDVAPEVEVFTDGKLDPSQVHDIADLLKQYFRELPEPLMTTKYSETFVRIFIHLPVEIRMEALQHAVLLLPDEHREALQTLLYFLHDIAKHSATNSMTPQNLAVCFAPSLFQLCGSRLSNISPTRRHKTIGTAGLPTEREIKESRAAQECLVQMIEHCTKVFIVPNSPGFERDKCHDCCKGSEPDAPFLTELGLSQDGNYKTYLLQKARELLKEHRDRWKGWIVEGTVNGVEISTKKSTDGHPLRFFRVWVDIEAPPKEILNRIVRERNIWDFQIINWRTVAMLNAENCDVFQYVINDTPSHPTRDATVVRLWRTDMKDLRGGCVLVERSVHSSETQMLGGVSAAVLSSQFLVEPITGRSRVTYVTRTDLRGRSNVWYNKVYGQIIARQFSRLRDSFKQFTRDDDGPETKV